MIEAHDLSSATLVKVQQCSCGGPSKTPVAFAVKYYRFPDGRFALSDQTREHKQYFDQMRAVSRGLKVFSLNSASRGKITTRTGVHS